MESDLEGAVRQYLQVLGLGCKGKGKDVYAYHLLSELKAAPIVGLEIPHFGEPQPICEEGKVKAVVCQSRVLFL